MDIIDLTDPEVAERLKKQVKAVYDVFPSDTPLMEFFTVIFSCAELQAQDNKELIIPLCSMLETFKQRVMGMAMNDVPSEEIQ